MGEDDALDVASSGSLWLTASTTPETHCCYDCGSIDLCEGPNDPPPWCCCNNCGSADVGPLSERPR